MSPSPGEPCSFIALDESHWVCTRCGQPVRRHGAFEPFRTCPATPNEAAKSPIYGYQCIHFVGLYDGESVEQTNCGCPGNKFTAVGHCALYGDVAPYAKSELVDASITPCGRCPGGYERAS